MTIPIEIRERLGIKPKDRVIFSLDEGGLRITSLKMRLESTFQAVPALEAPLSWPEVRAIAREDHAQSVAREGLA